MFNLETARKLVDHLNNSTQVSGNHYYKENGYFNEDAEEMYDVFTVNEGAVTFYSFAPCHNSGWLLKGVKYVSRDFDFLNIKL